MAHLFEALINLPAASINDPLTRKCFALLFKVLFIIQNSGLSFKKYVPDYEIKREKMVERVLLVLDSFVQYSILSETEKTLRSPKKMKSVEIRKEDPQKPAANMSEVMVKEKKRMLEEAGAFMHGFALIKGEKSESYNYFEQLMRFGDFREFLLKTLVLSENSLLQHTFSEELVHIYRTFKGKPLSPTHAHVVLIPYMLQEIVKVTLERETKCQRFYQLVCSMVKEMTQGELLGLPINFHDEIAVLAGYIKERKVRESKSTDTDEVIIGLLNLVDVLLKKFPGEKEFIGDTHGLVYEVLHYCLFEFPKSGNRQKTALTLLPPKCKSQGARLAAFNLLNTLACDTPKNLRQIIDYLAPIHV